MGRRLQRTPLLEDRDCPPCQIAQPVAFPFTQPQAQQQPGQKYDEGIGEQPPQARPPALGLSHRDASVPAGRDRPPPRKTLLR